MTQSIKSEFDCYGELARTTVSSIMLSGRNHFQASLVAHILQDVKAKLSIASEHRLLEIGCNIGLMLSPLSQGAREAVGVDHPVIIERYRKMGVPNNTTLIEGYWPHVLVPGMFDRILVLSVLHSLRSATEAMTFLKACFSILAPGGRLLISDLPNEDMRSRYLESRSGARIASEYAHAIDEARASTVAEEYTRRDEIFAEAKDVVFINDDFILQVLGESRKSGLDAFVLPQPPELPYSQSREDILIMRRG